MFRQGGQICVKDSHTCFLQVFTCEMTKALTNLFSAFFRFFRNVSTCVLPLTTMFLLLSFAFFWISCISNYVKHYDQPNSHSELLTLQDYDFFTQWVTHNHFHKEDNILITFLSQIIKGINQVLSIFYKRSFSFTVVIPPKY